MSDPDTQMRHDNADASRWRVPGVATLLVLAVFVICATMLLGLYSSQSGIRRVRALGGEVDCGWNALSDTVTDFVDIDPGLLTTDADVHTVWVEGPAFTDETLGVLRRFPGVEHVYLEQSGVTDDGLQQLTATTTITDLKISNSPQITDAGIAKLARLPHLRYLYLKGMQVKGEGIAALDQIDTLHLWGCPRVDDTTLEHVGELSNLTALSLADASVTDAGLRHLAGLTRLNALVLDRTKITDEGLATIVELNPQLTHLLLDGVRGITDEGVLKLSALKSLRMLSIQSTNISNEAVDKLSQALPRCDVVHSKSAEYQIPLPVPTPNQ